MSLEKLTTISKIEFAGLYKTLFVETVTNILENGNSISNSIHRESYEPQDILNLPAELQPYVQGVWTDELIADFQNYLNSLNEVAEQPQE